MKKSTVAEESSGVTTKQIVGYLWPIPLLKKHDRPVPPNKRLQSIQHQGKTIKGAILEEWVIGTLLSHLSICFYVVTEWFRV